MCSARSDDIGFCVCVHLALTCIFPDPGTDHIILGGYGLQNVQVDQSCDKDFEQRKFACYIQIFPLHVD